MEKPNAGVRSSEILVDAAIAGWSSFLLTGLHRLQQDSRLCDAVIATRDGTSFHVHSSVLSASSPTLAEYFSSDVTVIKRQGDSVVFPMHAYSSPAAETLIRFIYTGCISCLKENVPEVLHLAEHLGMKMLVSGLKERFACDSEAVRYQPELLTEDVCTVTNSVRDLTDSAQQSVSLRQQPDDGPVKLETNVVVEATTTAEEMTLANYGVAGVLKDQTDQDRRPSQDGSTSTDAEPVAQGEPLSAKVNDTRSIKDGGGIPAPRRSGRKRVSKRESWTITQEDIGAHQDADCCPVRNTRKGHTRSTPGVATELSDDSRRWACVYCGKVFNQLSILRRHERAHRGTLPFKCDVCDKRYMFKNQLKSHLMSHTGERPFQCKYCSKTYTTRTTLDTHERYFCKVARLKAEKLTCETCHTKFWSQRCLEDHKCGGTISTESLRTVASKEHVHGVTMYQCKLCPRKFPRIQSFRAHQLTHTQRVMEHACPLCPKRFMYKQSLERHEMMHRGQKDFQCSFCAKTFYTLGDCKLHERVHTGDKPFPCQVCGKCFRSHSSVKNHVRRHNDERNYQCKVCGKRFVDTSHMKRHEAIHTSQLPYSCKLCAKAFRRRDNMRRHYVTMHKNMAEQYLQLMNTPSSSVVGEGC